MSWNRSTPTGGLSSGLGRRWLIVASLVSMALVVATGGRTLLSGGSALHRALHPLDLSIENEIAAWWSGMLLLLASLHAYDGAKRMKARARGLSASDSRQGSSWSDPTVMTDAARAWTVIAGILLFFSLDEVGSIHERMGALAWPLGHSEFAVYGVAAVILGGLAIFALHRLWRVPDLRGSAVGLLIGFSLLASVVIHEYLEHTVEWSALAAAFRVAVEEGTELTGILLILFVTMPNTTGMRNLHGEPDPLDRESPIPLGALRSPSLRMVVLGLIACVGLALVSALLPDQQRGHPANWFAAAGFLGAALSELRRDIGTPGPDSDAGIGSKGASAEMPRDRRARRASAAIGIAASAAAVAVAPVELMEVGPVWLAGQAWLNERLTLLSACVVLVAILGYNRSGRFERDRGRTRSRRVYVLLGAAGFLAAGVGLAFSTDLFLSYLFTTLLGFGCYVATVFRTRQLRA